MGAFMEACNQELVESGEFVDAQGLAAPVHTRRVELQDGVPVVTDGPYAGDPGGAGRLHRSSSATSFDRATEIAARLATCPTRTMPRRAVRRRPADRRRRRRPGRLTSRHGPGRRVEDLLRPLAPQVLGAVVRRYGHFDTAEDAVQEALLAAAAQWPRDGRAGQPARLADHRRRPPADRPAAQRAGPAAPGGHRRPLDYLPDRLARPRRPTSAAGRRRRHADPAVPVLPPVAVAGRRRSR